MELLKKLSKIQITILLLIAGITSLIALNGLSKYALDYYVSAAISRAFFWAILLLVISSPFLYYFRRKEKTRNNENKQPGVMDSVIEGVLIIIILAMITLWGLGILGVL